MREHSRRCREKKERREREIEADEARPNAVEKVYQGAEMVYRLWRRVKKKTKKKR